MAHGLEKGDAVHLAGLCSVVEMVGYLSPKISPKLWADMLSHQKLEELITAGPFCAAVESPDIRTASLEQKLCVPGFFLQGVLDNCVAFGIHLDE